MSAGRRGQDGCRKVGPPRHGRTLRPHRLPVAVAAPSFAAPYPGFSMENSKGSCRAGDMDSHQTCEIGLSPRTWGRVRSATIPRIPIPPPIEMGPSRGLRAEARVWSDNSRGSSQRSANSRLAAVTVCRRSTSRLGHACRCVARIPLAGLASTQGHGQRFAVFAPMRSPGNPVPSRSLRRA